MTPTTGTDGGLRECHSEQLEGVAESGIAEVLWRQARERPGRRPWPTRRGDAFVPATLAEVQEGSRLD